MNKIKGKVSQIRKGKDFFLNMLEPFITAALLKRGVWNVSCSTQEPPGTVISTQLGKDVALFRLVCQISLRFKRKGCLI